MYTLPSESNAPSLVIGFCSVVVWTTPTRSYGRITGYDIKFIPQGSGSDLMVSKGRRELFHAIGDDTRLISTENFMVQVWLHIYYCTSAMLCIIFRWEQKRQLQRGGGVSWCHWVSFYIVILEVQVTTLLNASFHAYMQVAGILKVPLTLCMSLPALCMSEWCVTLQFWLNIKWCCKI